MDQAIVTKEMDSALYTVLQSPSLKIPLRQRAKFEGWLKVELAHVLESQSNIKNVSLEWEAKGIDMAKKRSDLALSIDASNEKIAIMLKTVNTNFRFPDVISCTRPITRNIKSVIEDVKKLRTIMAMNNCKGYVCFAVFPVASKDEERNSQINRYLHRIEKEGCRIVKEGFVLRGREWGIAWYIGQVLSKELHGNSSRSNKP